MEPNSQRTSAPRSKPFHNKRQPFSRVARAERPNDGRQILSLWCLSQEMMNAEEPWYATLETPWPESDPLARK